MNITQAPAIQSMTIINTKTIMSGLSPDQCHPGHPEVSLFSFYLLHNKVLELLVHGLDLTITYALLHQSLKDGILCPQGHT